MIIFNGFPNDTILNKDVKIDFEVILYQNMEEIFKEKLDTKMTDEKINSIILSVKTIIDLKKKEEHEFVLENFIEFLIWFDKKTNQKYPLLLDIIYECANLTDVPNLLKLMIQQQSDVVKYGLIHLVNKFINLEFHLYNDNTFILMLKQICELYNKNYKQETLFILSKYLNEKAIKEIETNFNLLGENDIINIINGFLTTEEIKKEFDHINFLIKVAELNEN